MMLFTYFSLHSTYFFVFLVKSWWFIHLSITFFVVINY
ncbi:Uncharacterised protein [Mycobacteroides abscessus subsp. abscessus]|nr:Uncharacterised protein [Mycobacteroides abscessus subsp. abscessus]